MKKHGRSRRAAWLAVVAVGAVLVSGTAALATHVMPVDPMTIPPGPGFGSRLLATHNAISDIEISALARAVKPKGADLFVQHVRLPANADTGWHTHPGPALVLVVNGSLTYEDAFANQCRQLTYSATWPAPGEGFLDRGFGHVHRAVAGSAGADFYVVYVLPPGSPTHVVTASAPKECTEEWRLSPKVPR
jgi:hypothetical protein